tara:strand:+ start:167 stop:415 length:249 start_codon:yes stop_codon:yes gene_type:complete
MNMTKFRKLQYNRWGQELIDLVDKMESDGIEPEMAMTLLLDTAVDLTFYLTADEKHARRVVNAMLDEAADKYRNRHCKQELN